MIRPPSKRTETRLHYRYADPLLTGRLVRRYKRFFAEVDLDSGDRVVAHCTNTGAMHGCSEPGSRVCLSRADAPHRRLKYTWELVQSRGRWVAINTLLPNRVLERALLCGDVPELAGYPQIRREQRYGKKSRIDLLLESSAREPCYVEVKNVTLADGRTARFPDAVTVRGQRQLREMSQLIASGSRAAVVFTVARTDCERMALAAGIDPDYADALGCAVRKGVEVYAYQLSVRRSGLRIGRKLEFRLDG